MTRITPHGLRLLTVTNPMTYLATTRLQPRAGIVALDIYGIDQELGAFCTFHRMEVTAFKQCRQINIEFSYWFFIQFAQSAMGEFG